MSVLKTMVLATALALPITATQAVMTDITAEAKGKKAKKSKKVAYKHCGTYKYWKAGKCLDARTKKA